jgi:probable rRNA maturation factor
VSSTLEIAVLDRQRAARISRAGLARFLRALAGRLPAAADSLAVCLVSDRRMCELNRRWRHVAAATDVLAFPGQPAAAPPGERHLGDIVIAIPTAQRQARGAGHSLARETKLLALHGYMHLLGYDHETDDGEMMRLQGRLARELLPSTARRA